MASALTVLFLGCCLAGRSGVSGEGSYPKPSISVSPGGVIPVGGNVTIRCWHQGRGMRFLLYKDGYWMHPTHMDPAGSEAEFPIPSARREHGGSYTCRYSYRTSYSEPSDPVQIIVADPSLPRPSISLSPTGDTAPGANVTIQCWGQRWDVSFFLHRAGDLNPPRHMDPAGNGAEFHIPTVGRQHGGSYSCSYRPPSEPFVSSQPSDPVQLVVADPSLPRPSISLSPTGDTAPGANVTIRCQGQLRDVRFFLHKAGDLNPPRHMDPAGIGAEFHIPTVGRQHGGSYSCSYRPRSEPFVSSQPSDLVQLVVADPRLPRPSISLSPTGDTAPGANVTIRCRGQRRDVRFFLHKAGDRDLPRHMDPAGDGAEFHIRTVGRQHGGSYSCSYRPRSEPFVSSQPSHPVELVVAELLTWPIITGASAAAAVLLLLLLLVAFVCFRKTRARKGAAPRPSSTCPMGALKASAQQDPVYASINEGKEPQTLEPDPGADRVTYAELDGQALQAKRGALAPAPEPTQPSMYAAINVSQGALQ